MHLDFDDRQTAIDFLVKSRRDLKALGRIKLLRSQYKKAMKDNGKEFHDDIQLEYAGACKGIIAEEVGRNTGLAPDGIVFILDSMGLDNFLAYIGSGKFRRLT